jgi:glycosyltransferase involved in cell wall biosynthesis
MHDAAITRRLLRAPDPGTGRRAEGGRRLTRAGQARGQGGPLAKPLVSVITVCRNAADTLPRCLASVAAQGWQAVEHIVIDGASEDGTQDLLEAHAGTIDYYVSEPDGGIYDAMNKGLALAQGALILMLNADDWLAADALESLVAARADSGADIACALARYIDPDTGAAQVLRAMPYDDAVAFRMPLRHGTMLVPADIYDRLGGYDTAFPIAADRDFTARLWQAGVTCHEVPRPLLNFSTCGVSNRDHAGLAAEKARLIKRAFPFLHDSTCAEMSDPERADADLFVRAAEAHSTKPGFVAAVRALLEDRRRQGGAAWQGEGIERLGGLGPAISVIVPVFDAEATLGRCLDSILSQSLIDLEVILVDDAAVDGSRALAESYALRDDRVRVIAHDENRGLGASRNSGIRAAEGRYIFHADPDDTLPEGALAHLLDLALEHGADIVRGAYRAGQGLHGQAVEGARIVHPCGQAKGVLPGIDLARTPGLLAGTEGHWSCLYDAILARRVPYPTDLKMGQDSLFMVRVFATARRVTLTSQVVYNYEPNPRSAMNRFDARKIRDALEWRHRAHALLVQAGHKRLGEGLLFTYWDPALFATAGQVLDRAGMLAFEASLAQVLHAAGYPGTAAPPPGDLPARFRAALAAHPAPVHPLDATAPATARALKVVTLSTRDHGGAGIGSLRRIEALRAAGVDAELHVLFRRHPELGHVHQLPLRAGLAPGPALEQEWQRAAVLGRDEVPVLSADEMLSKPGCLVDWEALAPVLQGADVVHLHWVSGVLDFGKMAQVLGDTPVVWTLADMNAFTGGCHYSQGCEGFLGDCRACPLTGGSAQMHDFWQIKRAALSGLRNLHVVCPSEWLARQARNSTLLGDRPVHMIPNALPVSRFVPHNRLVARQRLGLPLDRRLVLFGAEALDNRRKGGDLLRDSLALLAGQGGLRDTEALVFGDTSIDLGLHLHAMGRVAKDEKLALIYAAADVFAFPSSADNAPLTVVESLLCGTPVVGFDVGNVGELLCHGQSGYVARPGDVADFARGLDWALTRAGTAQALKHSLTGQARARAHNDPGRAAARHLALYRQIIANPPPARAGEAAGGVAKSGLRA